MEWREAAQQQGPGDPWERPKEAIEMCLECKRKDCTSSCWAIKEILWRVNGKGGKKDDKK